LDEQGFIHDLINNGDDMFAIEKQLRCGRGGCANLFFESENNDTACNFHPGPAIFHEGYKGWKCCDRKTIDFEEFMTFETCAVGRHVALAKTEKPKPVVTEEPQVTPATVNSGVEVYKNPNQNQPPPKPVVPIEEPVIVPKEIPDPPDAVIPVGAPCLHRNCTAKFENDNSRTEQCIYHPGNPVFHEGSKGYSCCKKMTLLLEEFLSMEGCKPGVHKFVPDPKPVATVSVRHDFYQMGNNVMVTFYAKNCDKAGSKITFTPNSMDVVLKLSDGQIFNKLIEFTGGKLIDPSASSYTIMGTKVEVKLRKSSGVDWVKL